MRSGSHGMVSGLVVLLACAAALMAPAVTFSQPTVSEARKSELEAAFRVAWGKPSPLTQPSENDFGEVVFEPADLLVVDGRSHVVALVSTGENTEGCHPCMGALSVRYLRRTEKGFEPLAGAPHLEFAGSGYGGAPTWSVRRDLEEAPVLEVGNVTTSQGCLMSYLTLAALSPTVPRIRAELIQISADNSDMYVAGDPKIVSLDGEIRPLVKGQSFEVVFHGTRKLRLVYRRQGETFGTRDKGPGDC